MLRFFGAGGVISARIALSISEIVRSWLASFRSSLDSQVIEA